MTLFAEIALWSAAVAAVALTVACIGPHFWTRRDRGGDASAGIVIFVESVRWLGVRWGMRTVAAGLRSAGFGGEFLYWRWHRGWRGWLVLPAIRDGRMLERQARRLADFIAGCRRRCPDRPIYLIGYSAGGFVAVRALELLDDNIRVDAAATLAGAFARDRDLGQACEHVAGKLTVCSSLCDCFIAGLGTLLFGTADGRHAASAGMMGLSAWPASNPQVRQIRWRPGMIALGYWGEHFSASSAGFVRRCVAPALGIES